MDAIIIEGLKVETVDWLFQLGASDYSAFDARPQYSNQFSAGGSSQYELEDTLNYAEICEISAKVIQTAQPKLIEHAAKLVIDALFATYDSIESIMITIRKPAIIAQANSVGIRLERHRNDFRPSSGE